MVEWRIARFMCNNLLVIKSDFTLEGYCVFIPLELFEIRLAISWKITCNVKICISTRDLPITAYVIEREEKRDETCP